MIFGGFMLANPLQVRRHPYKVLLIKLGCITHGVLTLEEFPSPEALSHMIMLTVCYMGIIFTIYKEGRYADILVSKERIIERLEAK